MVYSLRKWMRLVLNGNPTVLLPLFVPESEIMVIDELGARSTASTRSSPCTWCGSACRAWSCWRPAGSRCRSPNRGSAGSGI
ncbi:hypothetical protein [Amycolatopsis sp. w19]|uniref:hypothetical protein n=1 Tax=Amycolatopsis sp. w19 TaxID=3448134 RepID=UPI003F1E0061